MKVVISISKDIYDKIKRESVTLSDFTAICDAIAKGEVIPDKMLLKDNKK